MIEYWIVGMSLYGCLVFLLLVNLSLRLSVPKERSLWVARMIFTTYIIELVGLWAFSTFQATVSESLGVIGGFSILFLTLFVAFIIVAVFVPGEVSRGNRTMFLSFRALILRAMVRIFGD